MDMQLHPHPADPRFSDLTGRRSDRLVVIGYGGKDGRRHYWICECDCGTRKRIERGNLLSGRVLSCGCVARENARNNMALHREAFTGARRTHGLTNTSLFRSWNAMIQRCTNPNRDNYPYYGGRGIKVCDRWKSFAAFAEDMGERPEGKTLDRINTNGDYEPGNCRWASFAEQMKSRRPRGRGKAPRQRLATKASTTKTVGISRKRRQAGC